MSDDTFHGAVEIKIELCMGITPATIELKRRGGWFKSKQELKEFIIKMLDDHLVDKPVKNND